jgi:hypothetical protein
LKGVTGPNLLGSVFEAAFQVVPGSFVTRCNGQTCKLCDEIAIVQLAKQEFAPFWLNPLGNLRWHVDGSIPYSYSSQVFAGPTHGDPTAIAAVTMHDNPHGPIRPFGYGPSVSRYHLQLESYVICLRGKEGLEFEGNPNVGTVIGLSSVTVYAGVVWHMTYDRNANGGFLPDIKVDSYEPGNVDRLFHVLKQHYHVPSQYPGP